MTPVTGGFADTVERNCSEAVQIIFGGLPQKLWTSMSWRDFQQQRYGMVVAE